MPNQEALYKSLFSGLRVIDLSSVLAGPSVAMFFAELGAHVIKIENPLTEGDVTRKWKLPTEDQSKKDSSYYASVNFGKEIQFLNFESSIDKSTFYELIKEADIVITNFKESALNKFNINYNHLMAFNDKIIFAHLSSFQIEDKPAYDVIMQAETGWLAMTGEKDSLAKMPVALIDVVAAHQLKEAILIALFRKEKISQGSHIKVSLEHAAISALVNQGANYLNEGHIPKPIGTCHPNIAPYGDIFYTADSLAFVLAIVSDKLFKVLVEEILKDVTFHHFRTNTLRLENRSELYKALSSKFREMEADVLFSQFDKFKIPYGKVKSMDKVFQNGQYNSMILEQNFENSYQMLKSVAFEFLN